MKILKLSFLTLVMVGTFQFQAKAQHEIKTNATALIFADWNIQYEYVTEEMGFLLGISYFVPGTLINADDVYKALRITPEFRYYFNPDEDASGFFASGYLRFRSVTSEDWYYNSYFDNNGNLVEEYSDMKNTGVALGFTLGYKWVTRSGLVFETFAGLGRYLVNNYSFDPDPNDPTLTEGFEDLPGFDTRFGFAVGYRFGG